MYQTTLENSIRMNMCIFCFDFGYLSIAFAVKNEITQFYAPQTNCFTKNKQTNTQTNNKIESKRVWSRMNGMKYYK